MSTNDEVIVAEQDDTAVDFSKMKKKPKKSKTFSLSSSQNLSENANSSTGDQQSGTISESIDQQIDSSSVPISGDDNLVFREEGAEEEPEVYIEAWLKSDRDYTYTELLDRMVRILHKNNPALACGRKRYTMVPPQVAREGSKKTSFANLADICQRMKRNMDHAIQFLFTELGTTGSIDAAQRLIIKGRFQQKQIENVLRRYIVEYVTCKTCKSPDTNLEKKDRLYFMQCSSCGSRRSVSAIKSGYQLLTGSRRAAKAKAS